MINATSTGSGRDFEPIPSGNYIARCYSMIHLGTAMEEFLGEKKEMNKVRIGFELPTELKVFKEENGEQPCAISKEFTLSMHEKSNLRKQLEGWRGKAFTEDEAMLFDITRLLGVPCMLNIIHKQSKAGKTYAEIASISGLPKGMTCPPQVNARFEFNFTDSFSLPELEKMPDFIKDRIKRSTEYLQLMHSAHHIPANNNDDTTDDCPF